MKPLKNPFILTGFYGKVYFCDREKELKSLHNHFDNERNIVLYSWRRLGKTALIKYFLSILEKQNKTETVYVDLLGTINMTTSLRQITEAVYHRFGKTSHGISNVFQQLLGKLGAELSFDSYSGIPVLNIGLRNTHAPEQSLQSIGEFLQDRNKQVIVALDEFQQIVHYEDNNGEAYFRSWMQNFPGIRFIFSGSHRHMMLSMFAEKNRPFYRSAQLVQLGPIPLNKYRSFIRRHFQSHKKTINDEAIEVIYLWSRQQTYCIQLVCNKLFGTYDKAEIETTTDVFEEILEQESPLFINYRNLLTGTQWKVLQSIAKGEPLTNPLSKDFITKYDLGASSSVETAMKSLIKKELVIKEGNFYLVHDVLLARWLQSL